MELTLIVLAGALVIAMIGVWVVLSGSFRVGQVRGDEGAEGRWAHAGRIGSVASPSLVILGFAAVVGVFLLVIGVVVVRP